MKCNEDVYEWKQTDKITQFNGMMYYNLKKSCVY